MVFIDDMGWGDFSCFGNKDVQTPNADRLAKEGKIIMAGPIGVEDDLRGIFIMNCADSTEVENFVKNEYSDKKTY